MITDRQMRLLMSLIEQGKPLFLAAAKAGMSEPTARKWRALGTLPSQVKGERDWRTRADPFEAVWAEVEALLERDPGLEAKTVFEELVRRYPDRFRPGQLRTLQRRFRIWRGLHGKEREVFFPQEHRPGEQCQSDFTDMKALGVTIAGEPLAHCCYHFVLTYSNWEAASVAYSETFEALSEGLQAALWSLGGVPQEHRTDNLSAATHELRFSRGRGFTERYQALLEHYGLRGSTNHPGRAHENGDVESAHDGFKRAVDQRLRLRGHRDFSSLPAYRSFLAALVADRNRTRAERLAEERAVLRPLPVRPLPCWRELTVRVSRWSTIRVANKPYSVPSRLIGARVEVRLQATELTVRYGGQEVERLERVVGREARIDYRHLIHSLVRKPGAFRRYVYREQLYPSLTFRRAYDALVADAPRRADLEYLRILHLAATTLESAVEQVLAELLAAGIVPGYEQVQARVRPQPPAAAPVLAVPAVDLRAYDALLTMEPAPS